MKLGGRRGRGKTHGLGQVQSQPLAGTAEQESGGGEILTGTLGMLSVGNVIIAHERVVGESTGGERNSGNGLRARQKKTMRRERLLITRYVTIEDVVPLPLRSGTVSHPRGSKGFKKGCGKKIIAEKRAESNPTRPRKLPFP